MSELVNAILKTLAENPGIPRKDLAGKIIVDLAPEEMEPRKMALASDLHWLISAGHVIEFNDGSLDLPRAKIKTVEAAVLAVGNEGTIPSGESAVDTTAATPTA